ncbi:hypothetical protein COW36_21190 [bacterium (Candidatus Blackallbacteria) CG17_big_fil_post_rev_8_21_14_2_50_48_46]|uniref:Peptidase C39-like domain-containing protein n=1 Tax=bacterium (Candidatus Blackallbacteria) CG17_big_fil_post_rev_8_21_14_2_50_48_46 TaxID=2014261 RepID=A0A2M7FZI7_9BACT|nr:MAG: hypothetical protein COW64_14500 [bacterium (Candidatus Blackallbacteria) CG18_big_fil_WC_8_21_14_2_50_49_26]PIW14556.1 MAG: hypothetical protein COW36_21190 [bacterium (Candidatus Blackallbacteria) CG17_big_fil_post_rev_8_21_14_2_50_48_46]PIW47241.1 MAG: hypothetical protein COW20_13635 [bacterium (Candidatus Blackallbacteria) CG13_big_fil_rev_8_21_14_2_50_49_14]
MKKNTSFKISLSLLLLSGVVSACTPANLNTLVSALKPEKPAVSQEPFASRPAMAIDDEADAVTPKPFREISTVKLQRPLLTGKRINASQAAQIALHFLEENRQQESAWSNQNAQLKPEPSLSFYDGFEAEPGAFEFLVQSDKGEALGYLIVNTSRYVTPVPEYSTEGSGHRALLEQDYLKKQGALPAQPKFYRFSAFAYALAEAEQPEKYALRSLRRDFDFELARSGKQKLIYFPDTETVIAQAWQKFEAPFDKSLSFATKSSSSKSLSGVPKYYQHYVTSSCPVGCVPVAWSMLYGFYDNDYNTVAGSASSQTSSVEAMHEKIADYVKTNCGSSKEIWAYLGRKWGRDDRNLTVKTNLDTLGGDKSLFNSVQGEIDDGRPAIVGFHDELDTSDPGLEGHAVTAYGYYENGSTRKLYVNTGWTGTTTKTLTIGSGDLDLNWVMKVKVSS